MSIDFLPDVFSKVTQTTVVVPVGGLPNLAGPGTDHTVLPTRVEVSLRRDEGTPRGKRERAYVRVYGPRLLKSGSYGKETSTGGWECTRNQHYRGDQADRPDWLTSLLAEHLPEGWSPALVELPGGAR